MSVASFLRRRFPRTVHAVASWLIDVNTERAIYVGPGEARLMWSGGCVPSDTTINGAACGIYVSKRVVETVFEPPAGGPVPMISLDGAVTFRWDAS